MLEETNKPKVIVSTVGTSLLSKQIDRKANTEKDWSQLLRDTANLTEATTPQNIKVIIQTLQDRSRLALETNNSTTIRAASAELNGIYGLYDNDLSQGKQDQHCLIATDTMQGKATAEVVQDFLRSHSLVAEYYAPSGLSTATTQSFTEGIDTLLEWLQKNIRPFRDSHEICFNLVGGFKSLQGYLNTIGMFYADKILYIFEGKNSELITIPRLPIEVNTRQLTPHVQKLALMDAGVGFKSEDVEGIPEAMLGEFEGNKVLSTWGLLTWNEAKIDLLSKELLKFPHLIYTRTFRKDYNAIKKREQRAELQADLARVSQQLMKSDENKQSLTSAFDYSPYQGVDDIDHFRVNRSWRVSCRKTSDGLELRYYGTHDYVQRKEGV